MKYCQEGLCVTNDLFRLSSITVQIAQRNHCAISHSNNSGSNRLVNFDGVNLVQYCVCVGVFWEAGFLQGAHTVKLFGLCSAEASVQLDLGSSAGWRLHPLKAQSQSRPMNSREENTQLQTLLEKRYLRLSSPHAFLPVLTPPVSQSRATVTKTSKTSPCRVGRPAGKGMTWPCPRSPWCTPERTVIFIQWQRSSSMLVC